MNILPLVLKQKDFELTEFSKFFIDYSEYRGLNTFCLKILGNFLPKFSDKNEKILSLELEGVVSENFDTHIKQKIKHVDAANAGQEGKKGIPVNHFTIGFDSINFQNKIDHFLKDPDNGFGQESAISDFTFADMILGINQKYGFDIEHQPSI